MTVLDRVRQGWIEQIEGQTMSIYFLFWSLTDLFNTPVLKVKTDKYGRVLVHWYVFDKVLGRVASLHMCALYMEGYSSMSRTKGGKNASVTGNGSGAMFEQPVWVNVELTDEHFAAMETLVEHEAELSAGLLALWVSGNDISIKRKDADDFAAFCFGVNASGTKCGVSAGGASPREAVASLLVKWFDCMDGNWPSAVTPVTKRRFR
jgi:hypothetical protein